jgi:hypothetical protein
MKKKFLVKAGGFQRMRVLVWVKKKSYQSRGKNGLSANLITLAIP